MPCRRAFLRPDAGVRVARTDAGVRSAVRMVAGIRRHARVAALLFVLPALAPAALAQTLPEVSVNIITDGENIVQRGGALVQAEDRTRFGSPPAQFRVSVDSAPSADLGVCVRVSETGVNRVTDGDSVVTITSGNTSRTRTVSWVDDLIDNRNSEVTLTVVPPSDPACTRTGYTVSTTESSARLLIEDNESTSLTVASSDLSMTEGDATATATATVTLGRRLYAGEVIAYGLRLSTTTGARLPGAATPDFAVSVSGEGVTAAGLDSASPTLTFTGHDTDTVRTATLTFTPMSGRSDGDSADETIRLGFGVSGSGTNVGGGAAGAGGVDLMLIEPPPTVSLSVSADTVTEGGGGLTITATRSEANTSGSALGIPIRVRSQGTTAEAGDYTVAGSISIPSGASSGTTSFTVADDRIDEDAETVVIELGQLPAGTVAGSPSFVTISITDDDTVALVLDPASLTVAEGGSATYTVALATQPTGNVTVTVAGASGDVTVDTDSSTPNDQNTLTFTPTTWSTAQPVTVSAGEDDDTANDSATLMHSASGGGYGSVTGNVAVAVTDDDEAALTFSRTALTVAEGGSATYTVALATLPTGTVTVTVAGASGDVTVDTDTSAPGDQNTLTFTTTTWSTPQTVTVSADQDSDTANDSATLTHSASGGGYGSVTGSVAVTVTDNDTPGLVLDPTALTVAEGGSATYTVALATLPTGTVTVTVAGASGGVRGGIDPGDRGVADPSAGSVQRHCGAG